MDLSFPPTSSIYSQQQIELGLNPWGWERYGASLQRLKIGIALKLGTLIDIRALAVARCCDWTSTLEPGCFGPLKLYLRDLASSLEPGRCWLRCCNRPWNLGCFTALLAPVPAADGATFLGHHSYSSREKGLIMYSDSAKPSPSCLSVTKALTGQLSGAHIFLPRRTCAELIGQVDGADRLDGLGVV